MIRYNTCLSTRLCDGTEVVDEIRFGHTNTGITDRENFVLLVRDDANVKVATGFKDGGVGEGCITDFVESIGTVRNQFTKEDLLVAVEGV